MALCFYMATKYSLYPYWLNIHPIIALLLECNLAAATAKAYNIIS